MATPNLNLVHENEAQRRHARVRMPARIIVNDGLGGQFALEVNDLSASGFSVVDVKGQLKVAGRYQGRLLFNFDAVEFVLNVQFQVANNMSGQQRFGCEFHDLGSHEISTLRLLITKFLGGEITQVADVLSTMNRENFTKPRKALTSAGLSGWQRIRAVVVSLISLAVGLSAFGYIVSQLYQTYFVTVARSAMVTQPQQTVLMSRDGTVSYLVKPGDRLSKGAPLANVTSPLANLLPSMISKTGMDATQLKSLLSGELSSMVNSPCDCQVQSLVVEEGQFADKGASVAVLVPQGSKPFVQARFDYGDGNKVLVGGKVSLTLPGQTKSMTGVIEQVSVVGDLGTGTAPVLGALLATIRPQHPLDEKWLHKPVQVALGDLHLPSWLAR
jgi:mannuronan synthase